MDYVRSFIAIELPEEVKEELSKLQAKLKLSNQFGVKWVNPSGIHLTLKFLGNVDVNKLDKITNTMTESVRGVAPFQLEISELGVFPNLRRVQVVWVAVHGEVDKLRQLHQRLESSLTPLGFTPELRPFFPHLTLARLRDQVTIAERQKFGELIANTSFKAKRHFIVEAINLMRSQLSKEGAVYNQISSVKLHKSLSSTNA